MKIMMSGNVKVWPPLCTAQEYPVISAMEGGKLTLFEKYFVSPSRPKSSVLAPSMSFLISHWVASPFVQEQHSEQFLMLFDLGLRSGIEKYVPGIQAHIQTRIDEGGKYEFSPGVLNSLQHSGINPDAIEAVLLSHVHWDHHGDLDPFTNAKIVLGPGAFHMMTRGVQDPASHMHFDPDALPFERTLELPPTTRASTKHFTTNKLGVQYPRHWNWEPLGPFPAALDFFADGSVYVIDAPGHLTGHINMLCRVGLKRWVYLGGDSCHDLRLLTGEKSVATWIDEEGKERCIHLEKEKAIASIERIKELQRLVHEAGESVEVIMAHDHVWYQKNRHRFAPGSL